MCTQDPCSVCDYLKACRFPLSSSSLRLRSPHPQGSAAARRVPKVPFLVSSRPSRSSSYSQTLVLSAAPLRPCRISPSSPGLRLRCPHPQGSAAAHQVPQVPLFVLDFTQVLQRRAKLAKFLFPSWIPSEPLSFFLIIYKIPTMLCCINPLLASGGAWRPQ